MNDILQNLDKLDLTDYAPIPFWSWNNRLNKDKLVAQIHEMKSVGCGGFIMHARTGLTTEYLSEEWFSMVKVCLETARELKMRAWIYDENGWPSGFVGGRLLEEEKNRAPYLVKEEKDYFDADAFAVFEKGEKGMRRLKEGEKSADGVYHTVYVRRSPANTDILDPAVVGKFIEATHEEYYKRFAPYFGKELVGFFTDEPQYFRWGTPFTYELQKLFRSEYGEDVADGIIHLFSAVEEDYSFRVKYYTAMNKLYTENYYKRLYEWCSEHNCMLTGHSVEESSLYAQMWGCAGCSPSYEYEHIPGIDNLAKRNPAKLSARQVGSVAGQLGKKQILTETFGCCGYYTTPKELKAIAEKQYVHGVNLMCHHLYSYSLAGQGKTDYPPCFSKHMTWWKQFPDFNLYFTRLGWLLANSQTQVNCAVFNPMASVYLNYERFNEKPSMDTDRAFADLQYRLNEYGILYDLLDESILRRHARAQGKRLVVGQRSYDYLIVPECKTLSASTKALLEAYTAAGGKLFVVKAPSYTDGVKDDWSFLKSDVSLSEIAENGAVRVGTDGKAEYTYRKGDGYELLYIVNVEHEPARITVPAGYARVDLLTLKKYEQPLEFVLEGGESVVLTAGKGEKSVCYQEPMNITQKFLFNGASDNSLVLDKVHVGTDGKSYGDEELLAEAFDRLLRAQYEGPLFVKYAFEIKGFGKKLVLRREKGKYLTSTLNGKTLDFKESAFDCMFEEADITGAVRKGTNEYVNELHFYERPHVFWALYDPEATESVRNCLWYDTELENVTVLGDFSVDGERNITEPVSPEKTSSLEQNGFPYFAGEVRFSAKIFASAKRAKLRFEGAYCALRVKVNGKEAGSCFFTDELEIELIEGRENEIEIIAVSTLRNLFGPFHYKANEEGGVGPVSFTMRGMWKDGACELYEPSYKLRPFGLDGVWISFEK